jgi:hypothetical protein
MRHLCCTEVYLTRFKWDEAKFPSRRPLKETVEKIMEIVARVEDDLKVCSMCSGSVSAAGKPCQA